jgi:hypothetical protein
VEQFKDRLLAFLKILLAVKCLPRTNALAYFASIPVSKKKSFITLTPEWPVKDLSGLSLLDSFCWSRSFKDFQNQNQNQNQHQNPTHSFTHGCGTQQLPHHPFQFIQPTGPSDRQVLILKSFRLFLPYFAEFKTTTQYSVSSLV